MTSCTSVSRNMTPFVEHKRRRFEQNGPLVEQNGPLTELPPELLSITYTFLSVPDMRNANRTMHKWKQFSLGIPGYMRMTSIEDVDKLFPMAANIATTKAIFAKVFSQNLDMQNYETALDDVAALGFICLIEGVPLNRNNLTLLHTPLKKAETHLQNLRLAITHSDWDFVTNACVTLVHQNCFVAALFVALEVPSPQPLFFFVSLVFNAVLAQYQTTRSDQDLELFVGLFKKLPENALCTPIKEKIIAMLILKEQELLLAEKVIEILPQERQGEYFYDICMDYIWLENAVAARRIAQKIPALDNLRAEALPQVAALEERQRADEEIVAQIRILLNAEHFDEQVEAFARQLCEGLRGRKIKKELLSEITILASYAGSEEIDEGGE